VQDARDQIPLSRNTLEATYNLLFLAGCFADRGSLLRLTFKVIEYPLFLAELFTTSGAGPRRFDT